MATTQEMIDTLRQGSRLSAKFLRQVVERLETARLGEALRERAAALLAAYDRQGTGRTPAERREQVEQLIAALRGLREAMEVQ